LGTGSLAATLPDSLYDLAHAIRDLGGNAFLVGGAVRDHMMGIEVLDWDLEVFGLTLKKLEKCLRKHGHVNNVGRAFGVLKFTSDTLHADISIPRRDSKIGLGHRGFDVAGDPNMRLEEAVKRRDLTINAIAFDIVKGEICDPEGGVKDISLQRLHPVDVDTFLEDPLRAIRAVQFAARFSFTPSSDLTSLMKCADLTHLAQERIEMEWQKLFMRGVRPSIGLTLAKETGVHDKLFPAVMYAPLLLTALDDAAIRSRESLALDSPGRAYALMLSLWLSKTPPPHAATTLECLKLQRHAKYPLSKRVIEAITHKDAPIVTDRDLRWLSTHCELLLTLQMRHHLGDDGASKALQRAEELHILTEKPTPLLMGRALHGLSISPGPHMGQLLKKVYALQLDGEIHTPEQALQQAKLLLSQ
jgi:tRNA nucleotidyltransferase (CCA-adding enzyme)